MLDYTQQYVEHAARREEIDGVVVAWSSDRSQSPINQLAAVRSSIRARCPRCCCWAARLWCRRKLEVSTLCALLLLLSGPWAVLRATNTNKCTGTSAWVRMRKNMADGGLRTAGSEKQNQLPQRYSAYGFVVHALRMGGSVVTMGSVHVVCCLPVTYLGCVLTAHESLGEKTDNILPIRTYQVQNKAFRTETREIVLSTSAEQNSGRPPRAPECKDRAETSTNVSGRASRFGVRSVLPKSATVVRREKWGKQRTFHEHTHTSILLLMLGRRKKNKQAVDGYRSSDQFLDATQCGYAESAHVGSACKR